MSKFDTVYFAIFQSRLSHCITNVIRKSSCRGTGENTRPVSKEQPPSQATVPYWLPSQEIPILQDKKMKRKKKTVPMQVKSLKHST